MEIFIFWIISSFIVGLIGIGKKIGFFGAFFISILLSPLLGLLITLFSKNNSDAKFQKEMLEQQKFQNELLNNNLYSLAEELEKIDALRKEGIISDEEFEIMKNKIINN